ncbi:MAG: ester cyclase [Candidatus Schekmanbacteria bacterium]|nr:ester cyclase [Candidatus Schekmanbacteria bacterium]
MANPDTAHREMTDAWNRRDFNKFRALLHPDYTYTGGDGQEQRGPEAGLAVAQMFANAFPDGRIEIRRGYVQGDVAICEFRATGTFDGELMGIAPTGKHVEINVCNVLELRDGKIYREREYMDMLTMFEQLGVLARPGGE